jgi:hypothetical protein
MTDKELTISDWPKCPKCKSQFIVTGGMYFECCSCGLSGPSSKIDESTVVQITRARLAVLHQFGHRAVVKFYSKEFGPERLSLEQNMMAIEKVSQISRRISIEPIYLEAKRAIESGLDFIPVAVLNFRMDNLIYISTPLNSDTLLKEAVLLSSVYDSCSVAWVSKDKTLGGFTKRDTVINHIDDNGFLMMCSHFYGAPSMLSATPFRVNDEKIKFGKQEWIDGPILSWIKQPVQWGAISAIPGKTQPRWLSIREVAGAFSVSICIYEDLDKGAAVRTVIKRLSSPEDLGEVTEFQCNSYEEGVASVKLKIEEIDASMTKGGIQPSISFDREWEIERDSESIIMELRTAEELWIKDSKTR